VDINVLVPALVAGLLAARLGQRIVRERGEVAAAGKPKRVTTGGTAAAVCVALGAIGLMLDAVMVLVQHKAFSPTSAFFVLLLLIGILDHTRSKRSGTGPSSGGSDLS
jgi:hypothetical protein